MSGFGAPAGGYGRQAAKGEGIFGKTFWLDVGFLKENISVYNIQE